MTVSLIGPRPTPAYAETVTRQPGTYRVGFGAELFRAGGEGRWRWVVSAVDDAGRASSAERTFSVNGTLQSLAVAPGTLTVRKRGGQRLRVSVTLARAARVKVTIETAAGALVATLANGQNADGAPSYDWNGRDRAGELALPGRYLARVAATNAVGTMELTREFRVRRG